MTGAIEIREPVDVLRLRRFRAGETVDEIAQSEGVRVETVHSGIRRAAERDQMLLMFELVDLRLRGAIDNERLRQRVRRQCSDHFITAHELLLSGKRQVILTNKVTGEIVVVEIIDPAVLVMGIQQFRKTTSMEQKPSSVQRG